MHRPTFRLATLDDIQAVSTISRRAYEPAYVPLIGALPRPAIEDYVPWIRQKLVWLCEIGQRPVGVLVIEQFTEFWMIWSLAVDPTSQGNGYGVHLIEQAIKIARSNSIPRLRLYTNSKMKSNLSLYRKAGFYQTDVVPHPNREGHELVYMQLDLELPNDS